MQKIPYTLIRSRRKTIAIRVTGKAAVEVRAPLHVAQREIDRFVASKQQWIDKHRLAQERLLREKAAFQLSYESLLTVRGQVYPLTAREGNRAGFDGACFYLPPGLSPVEIRHAVIQVYRVTAKKLLTDRAGQYAKITGLYPAAVKINGAKTRWGSCSAQNSVNFSWRLVMADDDVIDYVMVHELAHIQEHNHSNKFWAVVRGVLPDYKQRKEKLKELQRRLACENWD
ncbi:MAG: M48 family metallopeptidase [Peptococcaceae bacterium]|nr:M48 family metallopeptidase [Peptococcaceae bacterium]